MNKPEERTPIDEAMTPWEPGVFRDYVDFVDRVARPMVEADDDDDEAVAAALALYRRQNPYGICISMVMMVGRYVRAEAELARVTEGAEGILRRWWPSGGTPYIDQQRARAGVLNELRALLTPSEGSTYRPPPEPCASVKPHGWHDYTRASALSGPRTVSCPGVLTPSEES